MQAGSMVGTAGVSQLDILRPLLSDTLGKIEVIALNGSFGRKDVRFCVLFLFLAVKSYAYRLSYTPLPARYPRSS